MALKIGFTAEHTEEKHYSNTYSVQHINRAPRKAMVQVYFADSNRTLTYYNDKFDLQRGDLVYVEGKLEGKMGRVTDVNYNFKIKISDYKRVISVVDRNVYGQFFMAGSHFVTFDRDALTKEKAVSWFKAPCNDEEEFESGSDDTVFSLDNLIEMKISPVIANRGHEYYMQNRVKYISIDGTSGYAIVEGSECYEVEFKYQNGGISNLTCSCLCSCNCKHEFAAMLQLKETLEIIGEHYEDIFLSTGYFAAINKGTFSYFAIDGKDTGSFTM